MEMSCSLLKPTLDFDLFRCCWGSLDLVFPKVIPLYNYFSSWFDTTVAGFCSVGARLEASSSICIFYTQYILFFLGLGRSTFEGRCYCREARFSIWGSCWVCEAFFKSSSVGVVATALKEFCCRNWTSSLIDPEFFGSRYLFFSIARSWWCIFKTREANFSSSAGYCW